MIHQIKNKKKICPNKAKGKPKEQRKNNVRRKCPGRIIHVKLFE